MVGDAPTPSTPTSQFLSHLSKHSQTPTHKLVQPYLSYETWLRGAFSRRDAGIASLASLVPIYDGSQSSFKIQAIDRQTADRDKYLMPLPDDKLEADGAPAIAASLEEYRLNFNTFTHGTLADLESKGRSADDPTTTTLNQRTERTTIASASDLDIFLYGLDSEEAAIKRILELEAAVRKSQHLLPDAGLSLRSRNAITFISPK
ncbi:hypothetical protein HD806DRAFT_552223 [Xylariaceae sp. AK1471]|nr:hypothetical protein HD806DRAFT_552223 [Xylariaceae sp. AK1471]